MDPNHPATEPDPKPRALALLVLLASCQSYEPRPLDPAAHRAAWNARNLEPEALASFVQRLERVSHAAADAFDPTDGLTLREGQLVALVYGPDARLARWRVERAEAAARHAGRWADAELSFSVLRITESVPDPWVIAPGLTLTLPLSGRLAAESDLAAAERRVAEAVRLEAEWSLWRDVQRAWIEWSAERLRIEETERFLAVIESLVESAEELALRGEVPRTEASLFRVEAAQRGNRLRRHAGEAAAREEELRALLGLAPGAAVELVPTIGDGDDPPEAVDEGIDETIERRNPHLARLRRAYDVAEQALRREVRKQYPDLALGPAFESDAGQSRIGLLGALPIPFLNANRRAIAEARVERELARAAVETGLEGLVGRWSAATARAASLASQRADLERVLVPLVDRQLADALELLRLGEGTTLVLLESLTRAFQTRLDLIDTRAQEALARTEARFVLGPPIESGATTAGAQE